ncbi:MAG: EAL domain-containing protein, partial [Rhodocyclales bacterium]|nr:EAL domain-containing protein [Rhodocyclales bacterium]
FNAREDVFQEDTSFGDHGDHMYYVSIPLRAGSVAALRIGFDEAEVDKHIRDSYGQSLLFTGGYVLLTLAIIAFFGHLLTRSVRHLRDISRRIASGQIDEQMAIDTSVSEISDLAQDLECMRRTMLSREHDIALREARQRSVLENAAEGIVTVSPDGRIESVNKAAEILFDYSADDLTGKRFDVLLDGPEAATFYSAAGEPALCACAEFRGRRRSGQAVQIMISVSEAIAVGSRCFTILLQDISERLAYETRLTHMATHDPLTGLPNRALYKDRLSQVLAHAERHAQIVALLFLDLDRFKQINDTLGHQVGDELLLAASARIRQCLREEDTLARLGGDEFTVILPRLNQVDGAAIVAENIIRALERPFKLAATELYISSSIGIACYPFDGVEAGHLSRNADMAMYAAKNSGGMTFKFYSEQMNVRAAGRLELETLLRHALKHEELRLYYQPQVNAVTQRIVGVEALVRWQHPELGLVPPADFIPLAEETGLIVPLSEWVFRTACRQGRDWYERGLNVAVAVNVSARHFTDPNLFVTVRSILRESGMPPHLLDLELSESMVMKQGEETISILQKLKQLGISLSLDDFGTGYSSLAYLRRFPIDTLNIDRAFIQDIAGDRRDGTLAATIIAMAENLGMNVVAEGVESAEQFAYLREHRCGVVQGYYFSRPLPADAATELLRDHFRQGGDGETRPAGSWRLEAPGLPS